MREFSSRHALLFGIVGLVAGILIGGNLGPSRIGGPLPFPHIGVPLVLLVPLLWVAFWAVLIVALVRGLGWIGGGRYYHGRLEDLPADFDDWHRRAHERMREAAAADDSGRRG